MHFEQAGDREKLSADANTIGAINLLFHASDHFQSTFDRVKGCTYEFNKQTVEGRRQVNSTLRMDYDQKKSILDEKNLVTGQSKHVESPIPGCMTDLLTGVFYASSQPMEIGHNFSMPVVDAMHNVPVTMKMEAREVVKTPLGTFKDNSRAADGGCGSSEEPRQHLDLVHRRRPAPSGADARTTLLGDHYLPPGRE